MSRNQVLGRYGEDVAARFLADAGLVVIERNWRCAYGEIDIVAREASTLVVCEVKTRTSTVCGLPAEAVTARKLRRMRHLAFRWLDAHQVHAPSVRLDVVSVLQLPSGQPLVEHLRGVDDSGPH